MGEQNRSGGLSGIEWYGGQTAIGIREGTSDPVEKQEWEHELMQRTAGTRLALGRKNAFVRGRFAEVWRHIWERTPFELAPDSWDR